MMSQKQNLFAPEKSAPLLRKGRILLLAGVMLGCVSACGEAEQVEAPSAYDFEVQVAVADENQRPVAKAPVVLDGNIVGYTDRDGIYQATLNEYVNTEVSLAIGEIEGYVVPETAQTITTLQRVKTIDGFSNSPVRLQTNLQSIRNDYLVWIDIECGEEIDAEVCQKFPIKFNGEEVAKTDAEGRAHFDFKGIPEQTVTLQIDTPKYMPKQGHTTDDFYEITPANPTYEITLGLASEVLTINQKFGDPKAAERLAEKKARQQAAARRRAAQSRKKAKKKEAKKAKDAGVIDLW
ncbi:hypothetical protein DFR33_11522 [Bradymonas sediminis]|nr:hypothetical protein DFR33_11522 [Bradymonas sediminis]